MTVLILRIISIHSEIRQDVQLWSYAVYVTGTCSSFQPVESRNLESVEVVSPTTEATGSECNADWMSTRFTQPLTAGLAILHLQKQHRYKTTTIITLKPNSALTSKIRKWTLKLFWLIDRCVRALKTQNNEQVHLRVLEVNIIYSYPTNHMAQINISIVLTLQQRSAKRKTDNYDSVLLQTVTTGYTGAGRVAQF